MAIVYTGGTFDLFHAGHVNFLKQCAKIAGLNDFDSYREDRVIVSLNTDEFILSYKGKYPVYSYDERKKILESCKYVSDVVPNTGGEDSTVTIKALTTLLSKPDFIVVGSDWACKDYYTQMGFTQEWLDGQDIGLIYVPYTEGVQRSVRRSKFLFPALSTGLRSSGSTQHQTGLIYNERHRVGKERQGRRLRSTHRLPPPGWEQTARSGAAHPAAPRKSGDYRRAVAARLASSRTATQRSCR